MLSRPRSLDKLRSINLTKTIREIIKNGPPKQLVQAIERTRQIAREAGVQYEFCCQNGRTIIPWTLSRLPLVLASIRPNHMIILTRPQLCDVILTLLLLDFS